MRYEVLVLYFYVVTLLRIILFVDSADSAKYAYQKSAGDSKHFDENFWTQLTHCIFTIFLKNHMPQRNVNSQNTLQCQRK